MSKRFQNNGIEDAPKVKLTKETFREALKIFEFVRPYRWKLVAGMVLLFVSSLVFMLFPYLMGQMVDIAQGDSKLDLTLGNMGWVLLIVLVAQGTVSYARVILFAQVSEKGIADIRGALYKKLVSLPIVFFEKSRVGELVSRLTGDVEQLYSAISITLAEFLRQIIILVVGIVLLAVTTPKLALIMLSTFPVIVIGAIFFGRYIRKLSKERQSQLADTNIILSESMQSINAVKAFTNEWFEIARYQKSLKDMVKIALKYAQGRALFSVFIVSVLFGALFFIIWQAAIMVQNNELTAGELISFVAYTAILGGAIAGLGNFYTQLLGAIGATERVREILNTKNEIDIENKPTGKLARFEGNIEYKNVHFFISYSRRYCRIKRYRF